MLKRELMKQIRKKSDQEFYEKKTWGSTPIKRSKDLPTLKLRYLLELLKKRKKKDANLLEVGCGSGRILSSIREQDANISLTGIDISKSQIQLAKKDNKQNDITFIHANGEQLPFKNESFDYVIIMDVLEHVDNPKEFMKEITRVIKKNGKLYLFCPAEAQGIYWLSKKIFRRHLLEKTCGHIQQYTMKDIDNYVLSQGLKIEQQYYSYHLLGSMMNYAFFVALHNKRLSKIYWSTGKYYTTKKKTIKQKTLISTILNKIISFANFIAYIESVSLKKTRCCATCTHIIAQKVKT